MTMPLHGPGKPVHADDPAWLSTDHEVSLPTAHDTFSLGQALALVARPGDLIVLAGPLGAGKTALTQGIGAGLGVTGPVLSPTFVIARAHTGGRIPLVHVDAYRLGSLAEVDDLDLDVDIADSVTVIEWGRGLAEQLALSWLLVELERATDSEARFARLTGHGGDWEARIRQLGW